MTLRAMKLDALNAGGAAARSLAALSLPFPPQSDENAKTATHLPPQDFDAGYAMGAAAERAALSNALGALEGCMATMNAHLIGLEDIYRKRCAALLAQILKAAIPPICEAAARATIARLFDDRTGTSPHADVEIIAAPDLYDALGPYCQQFDPPFRMESDPRLAPGMLQARWQGGGIDCDVGRSLFAIVEALNSESGLPAEERR